MLDWLNPFSKVITSVEKVASEWIETNQEKAEAQAVLLKAMDPNGLMRIEITRRVSRALCALHDNHDSIARL